MECVDVLKGQWTLIHIDLFFPIHLFSPSTLLFSTSLLLCLLCYIVSLYRNVLVWIWIPLNRRGLKRWPPQITRSAETLAQCQKICEVNNCQVKKKKEASSYIVFWQYNDPFIRSLWYLLILKPHAALFSEIIYKISINDLCVLKI